jgi:hypothetical protein
MSLPVALLTLFALGILLLDLMLPAAWKRAREPEKVAPPAPE